MVFQTLRRLNAKDVLTLANAASGLIAIASAVLAYTFAPFFFILAAGFFDFMDGKLARRNKTANAFGREMDSLADVISFGVAPAILVIVFSFRDPLSILAGIAYVTAAVIRLSMFNLQKETGVYYGLPVPVAAISVLIVFYATLFAFAPMYWNWLALFTASILMISRFKIRKPSL
ncbi:CDP-alcohol phosphatidyltransferase family protein [Candidatus Micrarchaeota archaeon]|nr:CDP-alcohol phosphatidyltransferase family protein [Candidatus Micrarchaeota archaeon]